MSAAANALPFVTQLRSRAGVNRLDEGAAERVVVRVQLLEQWETLAWDVATITTVATLKRESLVACGLTHAAADDYVLKLRVIEVRDESETVPASGARAGSTYLLAHRRRRAVR